MLHAIAVIVAASPVILILLVGLDDIFDFRKMGRWIQARLKNQHPIYFTSHGLSLRPYDFWSLTMRTMEEADRILSLTKYDGPPIHMTIVKNGMATRRFRDPANLLSGSITEFTKFEYRGPIDWQKVPEWQEDLA